VQTPDQPTKYAPLPATGVSFTTVPAVNDAVQVGEHAMPAGLLVTVPVEVPAKWTVSWKEVAGTAARFDESDCASALPEPLRNNAPVRMTSRKEKECRIKLALKCW